MTRDKNVKVDYLCSQPFWSFKKSNGNEFCKVCKHSIIDFSTSSTDEIIETFKNANGKTCGTFYPDQFIINEETRRSPSLHRLIYASAITFLSTMFTSQAQNTLNNPAKTEQHYTTEELNEIYPVCLPEDSSEVISDNIEKPQIRKKNIRGIKLFKIGRRSFYLSARFPFFHSYKRRIMRGVVSFVSVRF